MKKIQRVVQVWLPILILLALTKLFSATADVPLRRLMLDPTEVMHEPFYIGILANFGILLWTAAAAICLFMAVFLTDLVGKTWRDFFLMSGLLTLLLLLDDLLRIHDEILPVYLGIKGDFIGIAYMGLVFLYLLRFRGLVFQHPYGFLVMALGFFAISAAADVATTILKDLFPTDDRLLLEDGTKLLGIASWLAHFAYLSASVLSEVNQARLKSPVDNQVQEKTSDWVRKVV
jgi:hypothetical protein